MSLFKYVILLILFIVYAKSFETQNKITQDLNKALKPYFDIVSPQKTEESPEKINVVNENEIKPKKNVSILQTKINNEIDLDILSPKCKNKKFDLSKNDISSSSDILFALAESCDFSIEHILSENVTLDSYRGVLFVKDKPLDYILKLLLNNYFYDISENKITIYDRKVHIFSLNYISSSRKSFSNTDIIFSQDPDKNTFDTNFKDNLNNSKSGTKIYSNDEVDFWKDIENGLKSILNKEDKILIDKNSGLISISSNKNKIIEVNQFLSQLENKMKKQVFLDVELLSLTHSNSSNVGINWKSFFDIFNPTQSNSSLNLNKGSLSYSLNIVSSNTNLSSLINFLKTYGEVKTLSNPKITALNNQPAIISVGSILRYVQTGVYQTSTNSKVLQNTNTYFPSIFAGILLDITPSINGKEIILRINPSITKTKNPVVENTPQALETPPNLSTNQLSSIIKIQDGQRVIIGGLMGNVINSTDNNISLLSDIPIIGKLFSSSETSIRSEELIIVITAYVIE